MGTIVAYTSQDYGRIHLVMNIKPMPCRMSSVKGPDFTIDQLKMSLGGIGKCCKARGVLCAALFWAVRRQWPCDEMPTPSVWAPVVAGCLPGSLAPRGR